MAIEINYAVKFEIGQAIHHVLAECYVTDKEGILVWSAIDGLKRRHVELLDLDVDAIAAQACKDVQDGKYLYYREHEHLFNTGKTILKLLDMVHQVIQSI